MTYITVQPLPSIENHEDYFIGQGISFAAPLTWICLGHSMIFYWECSTMWCYPRFFLQQFFIYLVIMSTHYWHYLLRLSIGNIKGTFCEVTWPKCPPLVIWMGHYVEFHKQFFSATLWRFIFTFFLQNRQENLFVTKHT